MSPSVTSSGSSPFCGGGDLAAALAQLGLDVGHAEALVDLLLGGEELGVLGALALLDLGDAELGDREPHRERALAQLHVVLGRSGEVLEQVAVGLGRGDPQVDREPAVGDDLRGGVAPAPGLGDEGVLLERRGERGRVRGGRDQVDVLAGLRHPPRRAGDLHAVRLGQLAQRLRQLLGRLERLCEQDPHRRTLLAELLDLGEQVLLGLLAEALHRAQLALPRRRLETLEVGDPELVVEAARGLRPEPGDPRDLDQGRRELLLQLLGLRQRALVEQGQDLRLDRRADPRAAR